MFDTLSSKLQNAFKNLRGLGKISESNVSDSLREVRLALLDADVNFKVVRDFIERVRAKSLGQEVIQSIQPGQQIIKIIHDEMVDLLGSANAALQLTKNPSSILMVGLHGSGKTTSSAKLARHYFERAVRENVFLTTPLDCTVGTDGLVEYADPKTHAMWVGWALGMRCQQRIEMEMGAQDVLPRTASKRQCDEMAREDYRSARQAAED